MGTENDLPGISLKDEQRQLQNIIGIAQDNLDRAKELVKKLTDDLDDLRDVYEAQDKEGLALWNLLRFMHSATQLQITTS